MKQLTVTELLEVRGGTDYSKYDCKTLEDLHDWCDSQKELDEIHDEMRRQGCPNIY